MAEISVAKGNNHAMCLFRCCKALAEYRQDHFASAIEWANKSLEGPQYIYAQAQAYSVLAMAHLRLRKNEDAATALARIAELGLNKSPKAEGDDLGSDWQSWIFNQVLLEEAQALNQPASTTGKKQELP